MQRKGCCSGSTPEVSLTYFFIEDVMTKKLPSDVDMLETFAERRKVRL
jgi:hypothetical protein